MYLDIKIIKREELKMNKNVVIKSLATLTILTSVTGIGTTLVEEVQLSLCLIYENYLTL